MFRSRAITNHEEGTKAVVSATFSAGSPVGVPQLPGNY